MFKYLIENKNPIFLLVFHAVLGILSIFSSVFFILYFYAFVIFSVNYIFRLKNVNSNLTLFIVYLVSFEILARMAKTSPIIPYEMGKYVMFFSLLFGIFFESRRGLVGLLLLLFIIPATFYDYSGEVLFKNIVFNALGPINMALAIIYFYKHKFSPDGFKNIIRVMIYPCVSVLSYVFFKTPDFEEVEFTLGANFETTGGFGSNQVSTMLGLGMYLAFIFWVNRWRLSGIRLLDFILICVFAFQGLLSFSRGGMIGGAIGIFIFFVFIQFSKIAYQRIRLPNVGRYVVIGVLALGLSFIVANSITGGLLLLRYQGETSGTLANVKEKTLNTITTGRLEIFEEDIALFNKYPLTGVGVAASKFLRNQSRGIVAHVELSRLFSEHGILGVLYFIVLFLSGLMIFFINGNPLYKAILLGFFMIAIYSTFHAATRTFISPLLVGLSFIWIINLKKKTKIPSKTIAV